MQVTVSHQLVILTESYKFRNDGKTAANSLLLCCTQEFAAAQAYQEVLWQCFRRLWYFAVPACASRCQ